MPFWLFKIITYVCTPAIYILNFIPFFRYSKVAFAIRLLFWNDYKFNWVCSQAVLESNDGKSILAVDYHNFFGMGFSAKSRYQAGKIDTKQKGEPIFAIYKSDYDSVYDYYDLVTNRRPELSTFLNQVPVQDFDAKSSINQRYVSNVAGSYFGYGYFTGSASNYASSVYSIGYGLPADMPRFGFVIAFTMVAIGFVIWFLRLFALPNRKKSKPRKKITFHKPFRYSWHKPISYR